MKFSNLIQTKSAVGKSYNVKSNHGAKISKSKTGFVMELSEAQIDE